MNTRNVYATITYPDGTLATGVVCTFTLIDGTYTATEIIPPKVVSVTTHATLGTFSQELYCPASYRFAITGYPKETRKLTVPAGTSDIALTSLFASAASTATGDTIQIAIDARLADLALDDLADVDTGTPADGDVLTYNGSEWIADAPTGGGVTEHSALTGLDYDSSNHTGFASSAALSAHTGDINNPHDVTAAQIGALTQAEADLLYEPLATSATTNALLGGLTSCWTGFTGGSWANQVSGGPTLVNIGLITSTAGQLGGTAASLSGTGQYFTATDSDATHQANHDFTIYMRVYVATSPATQGLVSQGASSNIPSLYLNGSGVYFELNNSGNARTTGAAITRNAWHTIFAWRDYRAGTVNLQIDGGAVVSATDNDTYMTAAPFTLAIGAYTAGGTLPAGGAIQEVAIWKRALTSTERTTIASSLYPWGGNTTAPTNTTLTLTAEDFRHNAYSAYLTDHYQANALSIVAIDTDATHMEVVVSDEIYNSFSGFAQIGVHVNGVLSTLLSSWAAGQRRLIASLPTGKKVVEVTSSLQSTLGSGNPKGVSPIALSFNSSNATLRHESDRARMLIYGDSITVGANATNPVRDGWTMLTRDAAPFEVCLDAWGFRSLYDDANTSTLRTAFAAKVEALRPALLWISIGTNDYGLNKWSATSFGAAYAAVLDLVSAALPFTRIYCQTPLLRGTETANASGSTLGDYRTQINIAVSTRTNFATLVDGTAILLLSDLDVDQIHPTTSGHLKYARYVRALLGY